jgi:hypothetical protein
VLAYSADAFTGMPRTPHLQYPWPERNKETFSAYRDYVSNVSMVT